jgi:hypothetical protein
VRDVARADQSDGETGQVWFRHEIPLLESGERDAFGNPARQDDGEDRRHHYRRTIGAASVRP